MTLPDFIKENDDDIDNVMNVISIIIIVWDRIDFIACRLKQAEKCVY